MKERQSVAPHYRCSGKHGYDPSMDNFLPNWGGRSEVKTTRKCKLLNTLGSELDRLYCSDSDGVDYELSN